MIFIFLANFFFLAKFCFMKPLGNILYNVQLFLGEYLCKCVFEYLDFNVNCQGRVVPLFSLGINIEASELKRIGFQNIC